MTYVDTDHVTAIDELLLQCGGHAFFVSYVFAIQAFHVVTTTRQHDEFQRVRRRTNLRN